MRFQDAARDGRAVVYATIQADPLVARAAELLSQASRAERILARAVMNGESTEADRWRRMFPTLFGPAPATGDPGEAGDARALRARALGSDPDGVARSRRSRRAGPQPGSRRHRRGAHGAAARPAHPAAAIRRERRILFDGVPAEIHPYDVTVEVTGAFETFDCKWGARGINADVLYQLDDARTHALDEEQPLRVALVVFDAERSCRVRLEAQTAPHAETRLVALEQLDSLARPGPAGQ